MFKDAEGNLCVWDQVVPNYTIFHEDDKTFSDCWTEYSDDFEVFYREITKDMEEGQKKKGIKAKAGQPANFYCISCVPWAAFTAFGSRTLGSTEPGVFPNHYHGKIRKIRGKDSDAGKYDDRACGSGWLSCGNVLSEASGSN